MDAFMEGVLKLEEERLKCGAERLEEVVLSQEHQIFLQTVKELNDSSLSQEDIYLTLAAMNAEATD